MSDLIGLVKNAIAYDEHQIWILQMHIDLMKLWADWGESLVSFSREYKAVEEKPDRVVISVDKLRMALVKVRYSSAARRHLFEQQYIELRKLACERQFAKFGPEQDTIEFAKPRLPTTCAVEFQQDDNQINNVLLIEHEVGEIAKGRDIGYESSHNYMWASCPICGKQEWCKLTKNGMPETWRCGDCNLPKRQRRPSGSTVNRAGYILLPIMEGDFYYPMANRAGYVPEHRLVMAKHLARCLQRWEVIHHKNGFKNDNRLENLELVASAGEHIVNHNTGYQGGYKHGLYDGRNTQIKRLKGRVAELEAQLTNSGGKP